MWGQTRLPHCTGSSVLCQPFILRTDCPVSGVTLETTWLLPRGQSKAHPWCPPPRSPQLLQHVHPRLGAGSEASRPKAAGLIRSRWADGTAHPGHGMAPCPVRGCHGWLGTGRGRGSTTRGAVAPAPHPCSEELCSGPPPTTPQPELTPQQATHQGGTPWGTHKHAHTWAPLQTEHTHQHFPS